MRRAGFHVLAFSTFFLAGGAFAQSDMANVRHERFNNRDSDRDGYLTLAEYGGHPGNFRALDRSGDNRLSRDEFVRRAGGGPIIALPDEFADLDLNADGTLNRAEWYGRDVAFDRVDRNDDGRITRDEFRTPAAADNRQDRFYGLDSNGDGVLSRREWRSSEGAAFANVDTDDDGVISLREYLGRTGRIDEREARFRDLDRDDDGSLERNEWRGSRDSFETADRNDDGVVTLREYVGTTNRRGDRDDRRGDRDDRAARFDDLDRDQDGYLERNEWRASRNSFDLADRDDDGRLTLREYRDSGADSASEEFRAMDRNRDGFVSRWEWSGTRESFARWDGNGDGRVSRNEYASVPFVSAR